MSKVDDSFRAENVAAAINSKPKGSSPVAGCPTCRVPLVCTMIWSGAEFYCLDCGGRFGFMAPVRLEPTPETLAALTAVEAQWEALGGPKILGAYWRKGCERCQNHGSYHGQHATDEERAASDAALAELQARVAS